MPPDDDPITDDDLIFLFEDTGDDLQTFAHDLLAVPGIERTEVTVRDRSVQLRINEEYNFFWRLDSASRSTHYSHTHITYG